MIELKTLLPLQYKQQCKQVLGNVIAIYSGKYFRFAKTKAHPTNYFIIKEIEQPLKNTPTSKAKKHNLAIAISAINNITLQPNQIFSFWYLVGNPTIKKGYVKSRAISGNELKQEVGGGLCQLSGLVYYLALHAGLQIIERHHHSIDIYTDEERFTPLGSDATVVYGYKDLQFKNNFPFAVNFSFAILNEQLLGTVTSQQKHFPVNIQFNYLQKENTVEVTTLLIKDNIILSTQKNIYKKTGLQKTC
jgi:vancomycin resistance protein VanW